MQRRLRDFMQRLAYGVEACRMRLLEVRSGDALAERFAAFGQRSVIKAPARELGNIASVAIGSGTTILPGVVFEALAPAGQPVIRIGDGCYFGFDVRLVAVNGIHLEGDIAVGHGVTISDTIHDYKSVDAGGAPWWGELKVGRPLTIKRGAWIGNNSVITGGITIGERAIIGANSVVRRDVPADTVVAGNPPVVERVRRSDGTWEILGGGDAATA